MNLTQKQKAILKTLILGYERDKLLDLDELLVMLPYRTTKQSVQFSIRSLIKHGLVEKHGIRQRDGDHRPCRVLGLTTLGRAKAKILSTA